MTTRSPKAGSQAGRILGLLLSAHFCSDPFHCANEQCGRVSLPRILALHISQYSARVWDLRHRFGYNIENGPEQDRSDHTWFRLASRRTPRAQDPVTASNLSAVLPPSPASLFGELAPERYPD